MSQMAMQGYTKLFNSILASSIWSEPDHTRIVWITILAMADKDGNVAAALPGISALSRIDLARCKEAIAQLEGPDEFSRTSDFEGRRIEKIEGGWRIMNYMKFKKLLSLEERREYLRRKQQEYRERVKACQQTSTKRDRVNTVSTHSDSDSDSDVKAEEAATAFSSIGFAAKFGSLKFQNIWLLHFRETDRWLTERMENAIQECLSRGIGVPPQFYEAKRDVEARESALVKKAVPL